MNTVFIVKQRKIRFLEVAASKIKPEWIYEQFNVKIIKAIHLVKNIYALTDEEDKLKLSTYKIESKNCKCKICGSFMLVNCVGSHFLPLTEEQEDYIVDHLNIKISE